MRIHKLAFYTLESVYQWIDSSTKVSYTTTLNPLKAAYLSEKVENIEEIVICEICWVNSGNSI